jgi:hypothetical protein
MAAQDVVSIFPEHSAIETTAIYGIVESLLASEGREEVVHIFGELGALADGKFGEGFAKGLPGDGVKDVVGPLGVTTGSSL